MFDFSKGNHRVLSDRHEIIDAKHKGIRELASKVDMFYIALFKTSILTNDLDDVSYYFVENRYDAEQLYSDVLKKAKMVAYNYKTEFYLVSNI